jgi:hypothetical protein
MAEDIRDGHSEVHLNDDRREELIKECERQEESCQYLAAGLYIWQKRARLWRNGFVIAPIILGGLASSQILSGLQATWVAWVAALLALLAGFFPAIYEALGMDMRVTEIGQSAAEYTNLRDRFRQAARVKSHLPFEEFNTAFEGLMDRMDAVRKVSPPLPEWCFQQGRQKIKGGDYNFDADERRQAAAEKTDDTPGPSR